MEIEKLTLVDEWGKPITESITDPLEMRSFFKGEMLCADNDFYYKEIQYYIKEVYLIYAKDGLYELLLTVELA